MDDAGLMARFEILRNLPRDGDGFIDRDELFADPLSKRRSFDQLRNACFLPIRFLETVDALDVRMVQ